MTYRFIQLGNPVQCEKNSVPGQQYNFGKQTPLNKLRGNNWICKLSNSERCVGWGIRHIIDSTPFLLEIKIE